MDIKKAALLELLSLNYRELIISQYFPVLLCT